MRNAKIAIANFNSSFKRYEGRTLEQCYGKCSQAKKYAYANCVADMLKNNGHDATVCSYNTFTFTFGYVYNLDGAKHFVYITPNYRYDVVVD